MIYDELMHMTASLIALMQQENQFISTSKIKEATELTSHKVSLTQKYLHLKEGLSTHALKSFTQEQKETLKNLTHTLLTLSEENEKYLARLNIASQQLIRSVTKLVHNNKNHMINRYTAKGVTGIQAASSLSRPFAAFSLDQAL